MADIFPTRYFLLIVAEVHVLVHTVHHTFADFQSLKAHDSAPATTLLLLQLGCYSLKLCCCKIAEAEAAVSVNEKKWLVMHMHVQLKLDELRGRPTLGSL
jgi:hypothetical protein